MPAKTPLQSLTAIAATIELARCQLEHWARACTSPAAADICDEHASSLEDVRGAIARAAELEEEATAVLDENLPSAGSFRSWTV